MEEISMERVRSQQSEYIEIVTTDGKRAAIIMEDGLRITNYKIMDERTLRIYQVGVSPVELSRTLVVRDVGIEALNKRSVSLEDYFLQLIQGGAFDV